MISFYPGPSRVYSAVPRYVQEAYEQGVLSINHRSPEFVAISQRTIALIKEKLNVPDDYRVFYVSSATECWEIISQSLVRHRSYHAHNGAFGQKWFRYAGQLQARAEQYAFNFQQPLRASQLEPSAEAEVLCLTHNETSNGTALSAATLADVRIRFPKPLIAVDATSSLAGVELPIALADVWYASVQKCFGLPAGMAVLICSPRAIEKAQRVSENAHYNSLLYLHEQMQRWQTTHTPNVLGIYLLMRTLEDRAAIGEVDAQTQERYQRWIAFLSDIQNIRLLVDDPALRSRTVIPIAADPETINTLREQAKQAGITLGNGYGDLKPTTLRIANFPAILDEEIDQLKNFLQAF
ncbi:MAG: aminotransferase class V-fold PLP-dependent enzyme [Tunicatimonas sp.]